VLKLATTGWRFARYYLRSEPYRLLGPPRIVLRLLAPLLVASVGTIITTTALLDGSQRRS